MSALDVLHELEARGVRLSLTGDRLEYDAPVGVLSGADLDALRALKPVVLDLLRARAQLAAMEAPEEAVTVAEQIVDALGGGEVVPAGKWPTNVEDLAARFPDTAWVECKRCGTFVPFGARWPDGFHCLRCSMRRWRVPPRPRSARCQLSGQFPWPEEIPGLGHRAVAALTRCRICSSTTFVRYGEAALCLGHATAYQEKQAEDKKEE
jgi:hypothetical protein